MQRIGKHHKHKEIIFREYPVTDSAELAAKLKITKKTLTQLAYKLKVKKCSTFQRKNRSILMKKAHKDGVYCNSKRYIKCISNKKIKELSDNVKALTENGQIMLANITSTIIERIKSSNEINFEFLTVKEGWE